MFAVNAGAILAKQSEQVIVQLNELGKTLGLIFQIKDNELGLFGDTKKIGKPVGSDIREGKKTLYYYYLLQKIDRKEKVLNAFGNQDLDENGVKEVLALIEEQGIKKMVNKDLIELKILAKKQINNLLVTIEMKKMMNQFLDKTANRVR